MTQRDKILSMIGMASKAGKTVSGEFSAEKAVKTGRAGVGGGIRQHQKKVCGYVQLLRGSHGDLWNERRIRPVDRQNIQGFHLYLR